MSARHLWLILDNLISFKLDGNDVGMKLAMNFVPSDSVTEGVVPEDNMIDSIGGNVTLLIKQIVNISRRTNEGGKILIN
jgi:hypothetical protein